MIRFNRRARGRQKVGKRNKAEAAYENFLELRKNAGEILWHRFEAIKLRLADKTFYEPDFAVMLSDGQMEIHEVKGHWEDDARVKIKVAAEMYPFRFIAIMSEKNVPADRWKIEVFE